MRKKVFPVEKPCLKLYVEYDYLTAGELGNILVRFQAATRSVAEFGRFKHMGLEGRPLLLATSVHTKSSIEVELIVAIAGLVMIAPGALILWGQIARTCFHRLRTAICAQVDRELPSDSELQIPTGLTISVTRGNIDLQANREYLDTLSEEQKSKLVDFLHALFGPARQVVLGDDELEITISREVWDDPGYR